MLMRRPPLYVQMSVCWCLLTFLGGFKMNFSALWTFWASLSDLKIQMRMWIFDRLWQWITRFLYDSLSWSMKFQLNYGKILPKQNFRDYLGWWAPQANFLWTFMVKNTWFFGKYTKFSHKLSKKIDKSSKNVWTFWASSREFLKKIKKFILKPPSIRVEFSTHTQHIHNTYTC